MNMITVYSDVHRTDIQIQIQSYISVICSSFTGKWHEHTVMIILG